MASDPSPDLLLAPINGKPRPVTAWLTIFHLVFVALDPFSERSAWLVETSGRILTNYDQADCRVAFLVGGTAGEAREFLGHWATDILTFADPDLSAIRGFGLRALPAIVHLAGDGTVVNAVEGWDPPAWRALSERLSEIVDWRGPVIPGPRDPAPFDGEAPTAA
ncbi:MAG: hypothetical protein E6G06_12930 [Actinobacteria bacterium]|nr:MAG: hypothetical protein E6G06_12930 [Actinomycetota bacterium]